MNGWANLLIFIIWGVVCYIWGYDDKKWEDRRTSAWKRERGGNYNGPPPPGLVRPPPPPGPPYPKRRDYH